MGVSKPCTIAYWSSASFFASVLMFFGFLLGGQQIVDDTIASFWREIDRLAALRPR